METQTLAETAGGISHWLPVILTVVFLIHTGAFVYLYIKRRHFYTFLLAIGFPFLVVYSALKSFQVDFTGMSWIRWTGILLATAALLLIIKGFLEKRLARKAGGVLRYPDKE